MNSVVPHLETVEKSEDGVEVVSRGRERSIMTTELKGMTR